MPMAKTMINAKMNSSMFGSSQINFLNYMGSRRYDSRSRQPFEDILMPQTTTKPMISSFFNKLFILPGRKGRIALFKYVHKRVRRSS